MLPCSYMRQEFFTSVILTHFLAASLSAASNFSWSNPCSLVFAPMMKNGTPRLSSGTFISSYIFISSASVYQKPPSHPVITESTPLYNPFSHLVYAANGADVDTVIINGKVVMENRHLLTIDETEVMQKVREIAVNIKKSLQV